MSSTLLQRLRASGRRLGRVLIPAPPDSRRSPRWILAVIGLFVVALPVVTGLATAFASSIFLGDPLISVTAFIMTAVLFYIDPLIGSSDFLLPGPFGLMIAAGIALSASAYAADRWRMRGQRDSAIGQKSIEAVYEDRNLLATAFALATDERSGWRPDPESPEEWAIVWVGEPATGGQVTSAEEDTTTVAEAQVSWHVPREMVEQSALDRQTAAYDGHDRAEKNDRLRARLRGPTATAADQDSNDVADGRQRGDRPDE